MVHAKVKCAFGAISLLGALRSSDVKKENPLKPREAYCAKRKEIGALVAPARVAQREPNLGSRKSCGATFCDVMIDIESAWAATNDG